MFRCQNGLFQCRDLQSDLVRLILHAISNVQRVCHSKRRRGKSRLLARETLLSLGALLRIIE